jgi:hypothetical protein
VASPGERNVRPVCRTVLAAASTEPVAERRCARSPADLWALALRSGPVFFVRRPGQTSAEFLYLLAGPALGLSAPDIACCLLGADRPPNTKVVVGAGRQHRGREQRRPDLRGGHRPKLPFRRRELPVLRRQRPLHQELDQLGDLAGSGNDCLG